MQLKKTLINTAIATAIGGSAIGTAVADSVDFSITGVFTMIDAGGAALSNTDGSGAPWYKGRTAFGGTMTFDLDNFTGSGTVTPFSFFGAGEATATTVSFVAIGDGFGNPGSLILGNMGFNWSGNSGIPLSIVLDAAGLFGVLQGGNPTAAPSVSNISVTQTIAGVGAIPATENVGFGMTGYLIPIGASPVVTTTFNTTNIGTPTLGSNPSGTLPLTDDGIGGSPFQQAQPFNGFNGNFDITTMHVDAITVTPPSTVPVPAAVWLFGSGLVGLVGVARRRRSS